METVTKQDLFEWMAAIILIMIILSGLLAVNTWRCHEVEMEILTKIEKAVCISVEIDSQP